MTIEAVKFWNEPNNKSHWAFEIDPGWTIFGAMIRAAGEAVAAENPHVIRVLGGISPIDPDFIRLMHSYHVLDYVDAVAVHGFPLDWNPWGIGEWPKQIEMIRAVSWRPIWVTEVGVSTFGAEEVQAFGLRRTVELLRGQAERVFWYSLYDLPNTWPAESRHPEAEGAAYFRHFHMGLLREDGTPKRALSVFQELSSEIGLCQWFHFEDHRLDEAVRWLRRLGVKKVRTGLSWADSHRPNALAWFDRMMGALEEFDLTVTFCFTPASCGLEPHHTSPPKRVEDYAEFCAQMIRRYVPAGASASIQQHDATVMLG